MGLLPTGLNAQHSATEGALAADTLTMLSTAVHSSQFVSRNGGTATYRLPKYFSDVASVPSDPPSNSNSVIYISGDPAKTYVYAVLEDGSIRKTGDNKQARLSLYVKIFPPCTDAQILSTTSPSGGTPSSAVRVYALAAWPSLPSDKPNTPITQLKNRQGYVETYISYVPPAY